MKIEACRASVCRDSVQSLQRPQLPGSFLAVSFSTFFQYSFSTFFCQFRTQRENSKQRSQTAAKQAGRQASKHDFIVMTFLIYFSEMFIIVHDFSSFSPHVIMLIK